MSELISFIRTVVCGMPGAFSHNDRIYEIINREKNYTDQELQDFYKSIYGNLEMLNHSEDKQNMNKDFVLFKTDFKKAIQRYKEEKLNGPNRTSTLNV